MEIPIGSITIVNSYEMKQFYLILSLFVLTACSRALPEAEVVQQQPEIIPDYRGVIIPCNIAPLNFKLTKPEKSIAVFASPVSEFRIESYKGDFEIPQKKWEKISLEAKGKEIECTIYQYKNNAWLKYSPFSISVSKDSIDSHLVYRKIAPGYRMWSEMGIYQRNLRTFEEKEFLSNRLTNNNCMNCHSFCMQNPDKMLFHQRSTHAGTYIIQNGEIEKLNTKTDRLISALVYPSWHPSGDFVAFSVNDTKQDFHSSDPNRIEVFDNTSDVVIYDVKKREIITDSLLLSPNNMETFPTFSPDGKRLFFCSAPVLPMPESFREVKYNLLSLTFDSQRRSFGSQIDTLYQARQTGRSAKFPRVSPDGRYLLYTVSDYGNFSIWHKDADLQMLDLASGNVDLLSGVNSDNVESYHSWSSNSRWFVFSSRRDDGLYTRLYICHVDEQGRTGKPFLLPQESVDYYDNLLFSFNVPELIKGRIKVDTHKLIEISKYGKPGSLIFSE